MILDTDNVNGVAGTFVVGDGPFHHGCNYVIYTDGTGAYCENIGGGLWKPWEALPMEDVVTLNEGTGAYETTREFVLEIANVVFWSPWTVYAADGTWYYRSDTRLPFQVESASEEATAEDISYPPKPGDWISES